MTSLLCGLTVNLTVTSNIFKALNISKSCFRIELYTLGRWWCSMLCVVTCDPCSPASCACSPAPRPPHSATRPRWERGWPRCCPAPSPGSLHLPCSLRPYSRRRLGPRHAPPYRAAVAREDNTLYWGSLGIALTWNRMSLEEIRKILGKLLAMYANSIYKKKVCNKNFFVFLCLFMWLTEVLSVISL